MKGTLTWIFVLRSEGQGLRVQNSLGTWADHSRCGWVNQGNIHSLAAILGANDLCHAFWSGLTQQLPCRREKHALVRFAFKNEATLERG